MAAPLPVYPVPLDTASLPLGPMGNVAIRVDAPPADGDDEDELLDFGALVRKAPPWLISSILHLLALLALGLWIFASEVKKSIVLEASYAEEIGEQLEMIDFGNPADDLQLDAQVITPDELPPVDEPFAAPAMAEPQLNATTAMSDLAAPAIGLALQGRTPGSKESLLTAYGGNATTEQAVADGLAWLVRNQRKDGSWSLTGPYEDGGVNENRVAATAMALLALQGAGHTHVSTENATFAKAVSRGWAWLVKQQDRSGGFFSEGPTHHRLYTHGQATIAICELYGMTQDKKFKGPAERAIDYALAAQDPQLGGWRYNPGSDSDTSVTGWFMMALQSAQMAYIPVPDEALSKVATFLDSMALPAFNGSRYRYHMGSGDGGPAMTAEALLCRQYQGWAQNDERLVAGAEYINRVGMDWNDRNAYYWYYATQVCHHLEGDAWKRWNRVMRQLLPEKQLKSGPERGSWDPQGDKWGGHGGRLMITCLHLYCLEVYYRHLPIYQYKTFEMQRKLGQ